ncbi:MAG: hypothetical protein NVSMB14_00580 [Isosphaeraceae bacterium]
MSRRRRFSLRVPTVEALERRDVPTTGNSIGFLFTPDGPIGPYPIVGGRAVNIAPSPFPTVAPRVESVDLQPRLGQVVVTFLNDSAPLNPTSLANPRNYVFNRSRPFGLRDFGVTAVTVEAPSPAGGTQTVFLTIGDGRALPRGIYSLTVRSGGIADQAGRPLDGEFTRFLPSGDGRPGGDFGAFLLTNGTTSFQITSRGPFFFEGFHPLPKHDIRPFILRR